MSDRFDFWVSGINVQPAKAYEGLMIERGCFGAKITQARENERYWFWIAIPSARRLDDDFVTLKHAFLRGRADNHTILKTVSICMDLGFHDEKGLSTEIFHQSLNLTGRILTEDFDIADVLATGAVSLGMEVEFEHPNGVFTLCGVGAWFDEK